MQEGLQGAHKLRRSVVESPQALDAPMRYVCLLLAAAQVVQVGEG